MPAGVAVTLAIVAPHSRHLALTLEALMPKIAEMTAALSAILPQLDKVAAETNALLVEVATLKDIVAAMDEAPPELVAAIAAVTQRVAAIDGLVPDAAIAGG